MTEFNSKIKKNSRILKIFMFSICALFACAISSHAQSLVKGTVTDGIGEPLPGVSVVVKGTTNGTITDVNGKYSIQATAKDILSFSYVGMSDQEIKVAGQTTINVVMKDDVAALDEVIVVGYGTAKKQSLTGAVSAVKGDELLKAPATNVSSLLGGRLPGISSVQVSGEPGDDQATLRVRGSIYNVTYIVDGMPRSINDIDPNDIESVSVLKDGASAAVYGLKGAGRGITMSDGTLVFPTQFIDSTRVPNAGIMYSKDRGKTWKMHNMARTNTTEAQVAEIEPGVLMLNMRDNRGGSRAIAITKDLGKTWTEHPSSRKALQEPVCMASLIHVDAKDNVLNKDLLLFSNPDTTKGRNHITIKTSLDKGLTWLPEHQIMLDEAEGWGYSCLTMIDKETIGILYESSVAHMTFQAVKLTDLLGMK